MKVLLALLKGESPVLQLPKTWRANAFCRNLDGWEAQIKILEPDAAFVFDPGSEMRGTLYSMLAEARRKNVPLIGILTGTGKHPLPECSQLNTVVYFEAVKWCSEGIWRWNDMITFMVNVNDKRGEPS